MILENMNIPSIPYPEALSESTGYGNGQDHSLGEPLPPSLNPTISDAAIQLALRSSTFCRSITAVASLYNNPMDRTAEDWLGLLSLLLLKCTVSERVQEVAGYMEQQAAEGLANEIGSGGVGGRKASTAAWSCGAGSWTPPRCAL